MRNQLARWSAASLIIVGALVSTSCDKATAPSNLVVTLVLESTSVEVARGPAITGTIEAVNAGRETIRIPVAPCGQLYVVRDLSGNVVAPGSCLRSLDGPNSDVTIEIALAPGQRYVFNVEWYADDGRVVLPGARRPYLAPGQYQFSGPILGNESAPVLVTVL